MSRDNDKRRYSPIGTARFDLEKVQRWYSEEGRRDWFSRLWKEHILPQKESPCMKGGVFLLLQDGTPNAGTSSWWEQSRSEEAKKIYDYTSSMGLNLELLYVDDIIAVVGYGKTRLILAASLVEYELYEDYSSLSMQELTALSGDTGKLSPLSGQDVLASASKRSLSSQLSAAKEIEAALANEMKAVEDQSHEALEGIKAELERVKADMKARQESLLAIMNEKKAELEAKMKEFQQQIFVLDSQIYSIQCYLGEVIEFGRIKRGAPAKLEEPVVLYQKFRYLDEELGRIASIYDIDGSTRDVEYFENYLQHNGYALDHFCPSEKCVVLIKISRTGRYHAPHKEFESILWDYEVLHGHRIAILIRNGDNLWIGWTDEERIRFDDDMFLTPKISTEPDNDIKSEKELEREQDKSRREMVSRLFVYSILQGALERKEMIEIPEVGNVIRSVIETNPYIIFSSAEHLLEDNRFGSFSDLVERCNSVLKEGYDILTTQQVSPVKDGEWKHRYERGYNPRGRGYGNRTHDVAANDNTVYPINLIEVIDEYLEVTYERPDPFAGRPGHGDSIISKINKRIDDPHPESGFSEECKVLSVEPRRRMGYYVSLPKTDTYKYGSYWGEKSDARANLRVYKNEFMNLTFMNSSWLLYAINSNKLGGWRIQGKAVDYAYAIRYLNKALDYVKKREAEERELILEHYPKLDTVTDWPALLSEWKLEKTVRMVTPYQAKRFAKWMQTKEAPRNE